MARVLFEKGHESRTFTDAGELAKAVGALDAIVVVKRLDGAVLDVALAARAKRTPLFLDLCDDMLSLRYGNNRDGRNTVYFAALTPVLTGVTVPSAAMAVRVRDRAAAIGLAPPRVHVIPDIAETRTIHDLTARFTGLDTIAQEPGAPREAAAEPSVPAPEGRKRVLWFGNSGAKHSTFGIFSLLPAIPALAELDRTVPLELVVVSNNRPLFEGLTKGSGVPSRYVPWSAGAVYDELARADVALLSSGDDEFSSIKSLNRTLQALAAGVPVVSLGEDIPQEFEGIVRGGRRLVREHLQEILTKSPSAVRCEILDPAAPILARYAPERIGGLWERLLADAAARAQAEGGEPWILVLVQSGAEFAALAGPLEKAVDSGLRCEILMASTAAAEETAIRDTLLRLGLLPRVYDRPEGLHAGALEGIHTLLVGDPDGIAAKRLARIAPAHGCRVVSADTLPDDWLPSSPDPVLTPSIGSGPSSEIVADHGAADDGRCDMVFVVHPMDRGSLLEAVGREIGGPRGERWEVACDAECLPKARTYVFCDTAAYRAALARCPGLLAAAGTIVRHIDPPPETPDGMARLKAELSRATRLVVTCEAARRLWLECGLDADRIAVFPGGADPSLFKGHARGGGAVGLSSPFHERENPDLVRDVVHLLPRRRFVLVGRGWEQYALFEDMRLSPNFTWLAAPRADYPAICASFDVFLSPSRLSGGPIPLLEAMMENAVPVASRTGFAPDLIRHGENGFLFDVDAPAEEVADLLEKAFALEADVRSTVLSCDWDGFARAIVALAR